MRSLSAWNIVLRRSASPNESPLPRAILTAAPVLQHDSIPPEVALLLPNQDTNRVTLSNLAARAATPDEFGVGLFLADPFIDLAQITAQIKQLGMRWVSNLPSVEQQDDDFSAQLTDIGLDRDREIARLSHFKQAGFAIACTIADGDAAAAAMEIAPDALLIVPRVSDFAAGFPSFRQRGAVAQAIRHAIKDSGWTGSLLGLGEVSEAGHETLWPDALDGLLCRPRPLD